MNVKIPKERETDELGRGRGFVFKPLMMHYCSPFPCAILNVQFHTASMDMASLSAQATWSYLPPGWQGQEWQSHCVYEVVPGERNECTVLTSLDKVKCPPETSVAKAHQFYGQEHAREWCGQDHSQLPLTPNPKWSGTHLQLHQLWIMVSSTGLRGAQVLTSIMVWRCFNLSATALLTHANWI